MAYCTEAQLQERLTEDELAALADHDGDGAADSAVIARAISDADTLIDSYLGARYEVPLDTVPDVVTAKSLNIAVYHLHFYRRAVPEDIKEQQKADIKWLEGVAAGKITLGVDALPTEAAGAPTVEYDVDDRHFGRDKKL